MGASQLERHFNPRFCAVLIDFVANYYFIRFYIFRRIKLIYKIIHRQKGSPDFKEHKIDMRATVLDDIEREVNDWATNRDEEMQADEQLAAYRRQYIGNISHELKTPIFSIQGFIHTHCGLSHEAEPFGEGVRQRG